MRDVGSRHGGSSIGRLGRLMAALVVVVLAGVQLTMAQDGASKKKATPETKAAQKPAASKSTAGSGGLTAFIDPVTGQLREPEPGEMAKLRSLEEGRAKSTARSLRRGQAATPMTVVHPSGAV